MGVSDPVANVCPPVVEYSPAEQARAAEEVITLPEGPRTGDWSDVTVLDADGNHIPWTEVSRIDEDHGAAHCGRYH